MLTIETFLTCLASYLRPRENQGRVTQELQETANCTLEEHVNECKGLIKTLGGKVNSYKGRKYQLDDIARSRGVFLCESRRPLVKSSWSDWAVRSPTESIFVKSMLITQMFRLEKQRSITIRQAESTHSPQEFPSSEMQGSSPLSTPEDKIPEYIQAKELMPEDQRTHRSGSSMLEDTWRWRTHSSWILSQNRCRRCCRRRHSQEAYTYILSEDKELGPL